MSDIFLTPSVRALLDQVNTSTPAVQTVNDQRAALDGAMTALGYPLADFDAAAITLPSGAGVHLFRPSAVAISSLPLIIYLHGGSFLAGGWAHAGLVQALADRSNAVVALIDYRRTPEHPLPAALDDVLDGIHSVFGMPETYAFDRARISILGDSAGGWLAAKAVICLSETTVKIRRLVLINPMITPRPERTTSRDAFAKGYFAATADFDDAWGLAGDWTKGLVHPGDDPGALQRFPPTIIVTNDADPVRDEGEAFAEALSVAGVAVINLRARGLVHAAWLFPKVLPEARLMLGLVAASCLPDPGDP